MLTELGTLFALAVALWFAPMILTGLCYMIGAFAGIIRKGYEDWRKH